MTVKDGLPIMRYQQLTKAGGVPHTALEGSLWYACIIAANQDSFLASRLKWKGSVLVAVLWRRETGRWNEGSSIWQLCGVFKHDAGRCLQRDFCVSNTQEASLCVVKE